MANTVFKLRRSSVAGKSPNTSTLSIGELAINLTDRKLFSSDGTDIFETGSNLTSLSVFSDITVGNSAVNTTINSTALSVKSIVANGSVGSTTQVLSSNGTGIYWASPTAGSVGGSNTQIQFNDSSASNGSADFTFNKSTNTITIGSSSNTFNTFFGNSIFHGYAKTDLQNKTIDFGVESSNALGNFSSYFYLNGTTPQMWAYAGPSDGSQMYIDFYVVGANQTVGSATLESVYYKQFGANEKNILNRFISNSTTSYYESSYSNTADGIYNSVVTVSNSSVSSITLGNSSVNAVVNSTTFSGTANNANFVKANTGIVSNSSGVFVNSSYIATLTANNTSFVGSVSAANVVSNAQLSANLGNYQTTAGLSANVATLTSNSATFLGSSITFGNSTGIFTTGTINSASFTVGTSTIANSTGVYTGVVNGSTISVGTSVIANTSRLVIGTGVGVQANGDIGTAGQILTSNGTTVYWSTVTSSVAGSNTQIQFNDSGSANATAGFTFDKTSNTLSIGNTTVNTTANSASVLPGIMYHNYQTINIDYTVANNYSASMVGPVTVATGKTLTINSGARFVVI